MFGYVVQSVMNGNNSNGRIAYPPYNTANPMDGMYGLQYKWNNQKYPQQQMCQVMPSQEIRDEDEYPFKRHNSISYQSESNNPNKMPYVEMQLINKVLGKLGSVSTVTKDEIDALIVENSKIINRLNKAHLMGHKYKIKDVAKLQRNLAFLSQLSRSNI